MGSIFDRLGNVIKSYLNDEDERLFGSGSRRQHQSQGDPDLDAAYEELDDFLKGESPKHSFWRDDFSDDPGKNTGAGKTGGAAQGNRAKPAVPEALRQDFAELGVSFGAGAAECKAAYKKLLKIHHPDRHAGHPGNMKKATEKSARINASYRRIEIWRETGKIE
ncbi:J domain-containing protein [Breznakiella homolactica]|uniref:J domain-containing protein n=1 Tax=Breznakiella homolactica TaxID=2798577 RepID=A0A7T7XL59_9SPIR|nr:J domain-containing protein [Breznakiella homolactica]QQO08227.1 J domain-containing protein [Breznakiella homolactica]